MFVPVCQNYFYYHVEFDSQKKIREGMLFSCCAMFRRKLSSGLSVVSFQSKYKKSVLEYYQIYLKQRHYAHLQYFEILYFVIIIYYI